ncbi:ABC-type transporter, periplasmic binding protein [Photobacterium marinum]|uniref:ABC-type transporter, periplasmic binding protein n=1 Tax=Photobacterium marinum TaxID=1056511 RepID=L8JCD2_9GAMM|nr:SgrR family transcriptional regulator [Photobacterium marinum]ELR66491.1 ABC-type transporter, periplasmic binding protein [Photobacterium marinum]
MLEKKSSSFISLVHLQRLKQLCDHYPLGQASKTDVASLAFQLNCSDRNIAKLVKTLMAIGWLEWKAGRGRGNKSELTLKLSFEQALLQCLESYCRKGELSEALRYAEHFDFTEQFHSRLPEWLNEAQDSLKQQNVLVTLVPYEFPKCHPLWTYSSSSRLYINAVYDTLFVYDKVSKKLLSSLVHHYEFRDHELWLRLRPDVFFHNGDLLTPQHVAETIRLRQTTDNPYRLLYRHITDIRTQGNWVVLSLSHPHPIILHVLAENHSAIFHPFDKAELPSGTGPYKFGSVDNWHWTLTKNHQYFGMPGLIEKAEFWTSDSVEEGLIQSHIIQHKVDVGNDTGKQLKAGCEVLEFIDSPNGLSLPERTWIAHHARQFVRELNSDSLPIADTLLECHQANGFHLFQTEMCPPKRKIRVWVEACNPKASEMLFSYLSSLGVEFELLEKAHRKERFSPPFENIDVIIRGYVFNDDLAFCYYSWLISSATFKLCLTESQRQNLLEFIDFTILSSESSDDFLHKLYRCEDWMVQQCAFVPLWREFSSYDFSDTLQGVEVDNMGVLTLKKIWFDD